MFVSIDWISFTLDMQQQEQGMAFEIWGRAAAALRSQFPIASLALVKGWEYTPRMGRAPYNAAQQRSDNGVMIFAHQRLPHSLIEVGGIGLDALGGLEQELALLQAVSSRVTRVDIAADIFTDVQPDEFTKHRDEGRFKSWSESLSGTGHTIYVGSKTSDRYARVYRYFEPHPRSQFLRVEHVLKAEQAKLACEQIQSLGLDTFVALLGNTFGWQHPVWSPDADTAEAAKAWRPERRQGKTLAWMYTQVFPAIGRLYREGVLTEQDLREALSEQGIAL